MPELPKILENKLYLDPKSSFQEKAQENTGVTPIYRVVSEKGPDHDKKFEMGVYIGDEMVASGFGSSKQEAEEAAASAGLGKKGWE